ncbi:unnamed protein product [Rotaria magnacalcarata]|uniref:Uncharacterized protein n=2 Tax=Rotaria magnacalcarata TaxID=392030 RepID=A0A816TJ18_9BILA|nr:unnamed protein product [Rotaria magnacalcarata]
MIHPKVSSPSYAALRKKRRTSSGKTLVESAKSVRHHEKSFSAEYEGPGPVRYADLYKREKARIEMAYVSKKKNSYLIAPDTLIPNSIFRKSFKKKETKSIEVKAFQLRLDILNNLQNLNFNNLNDKDDDEWSDLVDPDPITKPAKEKLPKGALVLGRKDNMPDIFKRMLNEPWWKQEKDGKPNLRSMLLYLIEILKLKQNDSFASACSYITEIFRTSGIEPVIVNQILDVLLHHLSKDKHHPLDACAIRAIAEFMIERKDIIVQLLTYALTFEANDKSRQEVINAIKFLTDINSSDDIELIFTDMSLVHNAADENFSLKKIIDGIEGRTKNVVSKTNADNDDDDIHPLLKKISEERWFPRGHFSITLDFVLDAIIEKMATASKKNLKTFTSYLAELNSVIGFSKEQFDRAANTVISILSHDDADYRLIAATALVNLKQETKAIDIALLNSFLNDARVLVRTECCDSLKKLTGIMSDTVLTDCANEISHLQTLPEDNFSLQNYLKEKNRVPTPTPTEEHQALEIDKQPDDANSIQTHDIEQTRSCSPSSQFIGTASIKNDSSRPATNEPNPFSVPSSLISSTTQLQTTIRVEINEKRNFDAFYAPRSRRDRTPTEMNRQRQPPISAAKTSVPEELKRQRSSLLPNNTNMWDSYAKQNENIPQKDTDDSQSNTLASDQDPINDPVQKLLDEHKRTVGFYRMSNRRVLIPNKVSMSGLLCDQGHTIDDHNTSQVSSRQHNTMNLLDLKNNQYHLNEVEFVQLLSSLVVRALQVHRQYETVIPGTLSGNFGSALNISPMPLHATSKVYQFNSVSPSKLPNLLHQRPTSRQFGQIQSNAQKKASKEGINVSKAQSIEGALSNLLKTNRDSKKSITISSTPMQPSNPNHLDITHAWLLIQLLKSQGAFNSENYLQKIIHTFPKFIPLLHTRIPQNLIPIIWNDPVIKQIASMFGNNQEAPIVESSPPKQPEIKTPISARDDDSPRSPIHYPTFIAREDNKKKFLPPIRGSKMNLPHHVLKFGYREIEVNSPDLQYQTSPDENRLTARRRRVCMHLMMSASDNNERREQAKSRLRNMVKNYETHTFMPIISRPPMF